MNVFSRAAPKKGWLRFCLPCYAINHRSGENFELRADLNSEYREKRKDAIKKVIANMTVGKGAYKDLASIDRFAEASLERCQWSIS